MPSPVTFSLYLITDRHQVPAPRSLLETVEAALAGGIRAVQLREKDLPAADLYPLAQDMRALTRRYQACLLVNDRIDIALAVDADGVHLGSHSLPTATARQLLGPQRLVGVSTHSLAEVHSAARQGANFVTFGPIFPTPSKAAFGPPPGLEALAAVCRQTDLPVFGLGGITCDRRLTVCRTGAAGIACISAIIAADDPTAAARAFLT